MMPAVRAIPGRTFAEPDPCRSLQQAHRFLFWDILHLSDADLALEIRFIAARVWPLPPEAWQRQRLAMLTAEANRRRDGGRK